VQALERQVAALEQIRAAQPAQAQPAQLEPSPIAISKLRVMTPRHRTLPAGSISMGMPMRDS
jgi:hypothetical protein